MEVGSCLRVDIQGLYPTETKEGCLPQSGSNRESIQGQRALQISSLAGDETPSK